MLNEWKGDFGTDYTIRQPRTDAAHHLRALLKPWLAEIHSVLEVGCNRGDNLGAFHCDHEWGGLKQRPDWDGRQCKKCGKCFTNVEIATTRYGGDLQIEVTGAEPNAYARSLARDKGWHVQDAVAHHLPFPDDSFDLVFTVGVLIHVPPWLLTDSMWEIHRVSRRFILAVEYDAPSAIPVDYRGVRAGIWKRPYGLEYRRRFPDLVEVGSGDAAEFDGCRWWLFDKRPALAKAA